MKKFVGLSLLGIVCCALQGSLLHIGLPVSLVPQLVVVLVVSLAFSEVSVFGCVMTFVLGLLMDFSSAMLVGPWAGALVVVYGVLAVLSHRLFIESGVAAEAEVNIDNLLAEANYIINNADEFLTEGGELVAEAEAAVA